MPQNDRANREEPLSADDDAVNFESDEEDNEFEDEEEQNEEEDEEQSPQS